MPIPKIIHQTNATKELPEIYKSYQKRLLEIHPDWEYRFYDDIECRNTVERYFPSLLPIYDNYPANIQRVDIFRIVAIYAVGGFYLDLDIVCLKKLDTLCEFNCVFGEEKTLTQVEAKELGHRDTVRVANYMFGCEHHHPFLLHVLEEIVKRGQKKIITENDILETTGPGLITTVYHDCKEQYRDIVLLPNKDRECPSLYCKGVSCHFGNYANHRHLGSWRWQHAGSFNINIPREKESLPEQLYKKALSCIQSKINKITIPGDIYILETYRDKQYDGLTSVFQRTCKTGILMEDTRDLQNAKVLVSGIPFLYVDKISPSNTNIIYTTFETDRIPAFWVETINSYYDYCIVPHPYIKTVFENSGVRIPVKAIHQGFTRYKRMNRNININDEFRIGFLGVPVERKNLLKLFQACLTLREKIPELKLHIHAAQLYDWMDVAAVESIKFSSMVKWTDGRLSENEIAQWYNNLSCYVFPSSGEGWSFTPRESLYLGIPTIISDIPVHDELVESRFYKVISPRGQEDAIIGGHIYGKWNRVEVADIKNAIYEVYENYNYFQEKAVEGSRWIEDKWTNEETEQWILKYLNSI